MFNKKNQKKKTNVNATTQKSPSLNMISEGTKIKGTIESKNDLRIAGKLEGEAICKGKVIITSSAYLEGNVTSAEADVSGNVDGTIRASQKLILRQSADVNGDLYVKTLIVEEGAKMNGNCKMGEEEEVLNAGTDAEFANETKISAAQKEKTGV